MQILLLLSKEPSDKYQPRNSNQSSNRNRLNRSANFLRRFFTGIAHCEVGGTSNNAGADAQCHSALRLNSTCLQLFWMYSRLRPKPQLFTSALPINEDTSES